mgnify:CR=1 FL=1
MWCSSENNTEIVQWILLTTTAIVAFAGAAAADGHTSIGLSGSASIGFNDDDVDGEDGFYWAANLGINMSATLDNGLTAGATFDVELDDEGDGNSIAGTNDFDLVSSDVVLSLTSDSAGLYFGDTAFAAETQWSGAGDMEADAFSEADGEVALRGDVMIGGISASVSYAVATSNGLILNDTFGGSAVDQLSLGASGDLGQFSFAAAYQAEADNDWTAGGNGDFYNNQVFGISAGTMVAGADITVAYAQWDGAPTDANPDEQLTSLGIQVAYPVGPVTATVYYVSEDNDAGDADDNYGLTLAYADGPIAATFDYDNDQGTDKWNLDGSYDVGNGLTVLAGMQNENEGDDADYYVAGTYDLGGGAELLVSYANDEDGDQADEIGAPEYLPGSTVKLTFSF